MKTLTLTLLATAALSSTAFAQSALNVATDPAVDFPRVRLMAEFAAAKLDLTDSQKQSLKNIVRLHQPELKPLFDRALAERAELRRIIATTPLDETALDAQATRMQQTHKEIIVATAHLRADLRRVLNEQQLETVENWLARRETRIDEARQAFLAWLAKS